MFEIEILDVARGKYSPTPPSFYLDFPNPGTVVKGLHVPLSGWALGPEGPPTWIDVDRGAQTTRFRPNFLRSDVAARFAGVPDAAAAGFDVAVSGLALSREFNIGVKAVLGEESAVWVGTVRGRRSPLSLNMPQEAPHPLLITSLGRSGSTWLVHLLGAHPRILAYRPFEYEPRALMYWLSLCQSLSEPLSSYQMLGSDFGSSGLWFMGSSGHMVLPSDVDEPVATFLAGESAERVLRLASDEIAAFYAKVAALQSRRAQAFFVEKALPGATAELGLELFPKAREIVLVRDPRDIVCSILHFNRKRGYSAFGRERAEDDHQFVRDLRIGLDQVGDSWRSRRERSLLVRYEDLLLEPEETLVRILDYLGLDKKNAGAVLSKAKRTSRAFQARHRTASSPSASIGRWRRDLDPDLLRTCEEAFGDWLPEFGYEVDL